MPKRPPPQQEANNLPILLVLFFLLLGAVFVFGGYFAYALGISEPFLRGDFDKAPDIYADQSKNKINEKAIKNIRFICMIPGPGQTAAGFFLSEQALKGNKLAKDAIDRCMTSPFAPRNTLCRPLASVADERSLPAIISNARWWPEPEGNRVEPNIFHCYSAMERVANTHPGLGHEAWAKWYDVHKNETRLEWVLAGFKEAGYEIEKIDESALPALSAALSDERHYISKNAVEMMFQINTKDAFVQTMSAYANGAIDKKAYQHFKVMLMKPSNKKWVVWITEKRDSTKQESVRAIYDVLLKN